MKKIFLWVLAGLSALFVLVQVFSGRWILSQGFFIGPVFIRYYGLLMAGALAAGCLLAQKRAADFKISDKQADDALFLILVFGFIGARIYHVLTDLAYYASRPLEIFYVWHGGLSIYGAWLGGIIAVLFLSRKWKLSLLNVLNWLTPGILLGQIVGRFGNLFNYELYGYPTNLPWKMFVPENFRAFGFEAFRFFHPLFLYEIIGNAGIYILLTKSPKFKNNRGLFFFYLLLYNALRFGLEFLRIDSVWAGRIRLNAVVSLSLAFFAFLGLVFLRKSNVAKTS